MKITSINTTAPVAPTGPTNMDVLSVHGGSIAEALNAKVYGNGTETLVLSHGYGSDQHVWHFLIPYLACYFKVVVFDLVFSHNVNPSLYDPKKYSTFNGYASDLASLLDELNLSNTIYMGHSMSAMIGCLAAIKRPELFQHLIFLSGSPRYLNDTGYDGGFDRPTVEAIFEAMKQNYSGWVRDFAPQVVAVNNTEAIAEFEHSLRGMVPEVAVSVAETVFLGDLRHILPLVELPSTIIQSKTDIVVPEVVASYMKRHLGGPAKVEILETKGHFPQLTAYPLVLKALRSAHIIGEI